MSDIEERLRAGLRDLADEVRPAPLLERLSDPPAHRRRQRIVVGVAACAVAVSAVAGLVLTRPDRPRSIEPATQPPKLLRLSPVESARPGAIDLAVLFADAGAEAVEATPVYLWAGSGPATRLPASEAVPMAWTQHLSADGTQLVRQNNRAGNPRVEVVDLLTGRVNGLNGILRLCPALSPDNRTVAAYNFGEQSIVELIDVSDGTATPLWDNAPPGDCGYNSFAWSPNGRKLMTTSPDGSVILDLTGDVLERVEGAAPANGSMSWSPDGAEVLVYRSATSNYALADARTGRTVPLSRPSPSARPMGWTGSRIVWLTGTGSNQTLVSTEVDGSDRRTWVRLVVDQPVLTVEWSRDLTGTAR